MLKAILPFLLFSLVPRTAYIGKNMQAIDLGSPRSTVNQLPLEFWGNREQEGTLEIGDNCGEKEKSVPPFGFSNFTVANLIFAIVFKEDCLTFEDNLETPAIGFEMTLTDGKDEKKKEYYKEVKSIRELFIDDVSSNLLQGGRDTNNFFTNLTYLKSKHSIQISFLLESGWYVKNFIFVYADRPHDISNVGLFYMKDDLESLVDLKYTGYSYTEYIYYQDKEKLKTTLHSQYGSCLSKDYLQKHYTIKTGNRFNKPDIVDNTSYFSTSYDADIGENYSLILKYKEEEIELFITVEDKKGPRIFFPQGKNISCSYLVDSNSVKFLTDRIVIKDNYTANPTWRITKENGERIEDNECGLYKMQIEAFDEFDNCTIEYFTLTRYDEEKPEIYSLYDEINTTPLLTYSEKELLSFFKATDEVDGTVEVKAAIDNYTPNKRILGSYEFQVECQDESGNSDCKSLNIIVNDKNKYSANGLNFTCKRSEIPTLEELMSSLERRHLIDNWKRIIEILEGEDLKNVKTGVNHLTIAYLNQAGENNVVGITLTIEEDEEQSLWDKIVMWFKELWLKIKSFFA